MSINIAIDGPAGAGKSTIAKELAKELSYIYVDTGAMYRAMALFCMRQGVDIEDGEVVSELCQKADVRIEYKNGTQCVILNGENVNQLIRTEEVGNATSKISVYPKVREKLTALQQKLAADSDVIMDGRDIGTCVLPNAQAKIYLTASVSARAKRRFDELQKKGVQADLSQIEADIKERDYRDMHRETAPLRQAEDAVLIDSSDMGIADVVTEILVELKKKRICKKGVTVARSAGFCFGVKQAVNKVYQLADIKRGPVYTYGPIIHNEEVVKDLQDKGVRVIHSVSELLEGAFPKGTVVIRSHGVPKEVYAGIQQAGFEIEDATCPFVLKIHQIVQEFTNDGYQIVIIGNCSHPEVEGIKGWCDPKCTTVIGNTEDARKFTCKPGEKICIVSQTTFNYKKFQELVEIIQEKGYINDIRVLNTICYATEERQNEAENLARVSDAMIVIGGRNSSNTQKLYEICKEKCKNTYYIQTIADLDLSQIGHIDNVGITAGASTPKNIIEEVQKYVRTEL